MVSMADVVSKKEVRVWLRGPLVHCLADDISCAVSGCSGLASARYGDGDVTHDVAADAVELA